MNRKRYIPIGVAISQSLTPFTLNDRTRVRGQSDRRRLEAITKVDLNVYGPKIQQMQQVRANAVADVEKKPAQRFLSKAAAEPGTHKTESGAIITTIKEARERPRKPRIRSSALSLAL